MEQVHHIAFVGAGKAEGLHLAGDLADLAVELIADALAHQRDAPHVGFKVIDLAVLDLHGALFAGKAVIEIRRFAVGQRLPHLLLQERPGKGTHQIAAGTGAVAGDGPLAAARQQDQAHGRMHPVQLGGVRKARAVLAHVQQDQVEPASPGVFLQQGAPGIKTDELQPAVLLQRGKPAQQIGIFLPVAAAQCDVTDHKPVIPPAPENGHVPPYGECRKFKLFFVYLVYIIGVL